MSISCDSSRILIAHVVYRLGVGGLENGLVNLINRLPGNKYRHLVIALTGFTEFTQRIQRDDVDIIALDKRPGHDWNMYRDLYRIFRDRKPGIVHSRNLAAMEAQVPAWLAGVPCRVHGEHGRDVLDVDGRNWKYILQRKILRPFITQYIALSIELESYLRETIGVPGQRITRIINGVDIQRFKPNAAIGCDFLPDGFLKSNALIIGTVGRLEKIKDQMTLIEAFAVLRRNHPDQMDRLRLVIVGDGSMRSTLERRIVENDLGDSVWLAGNRDDVPELLQCMDIFVLPSLAEGISNTIMEAMATGLPVVATDVGGNRELVMENNGSLVPRSDPQSMADALSRYLVEPALLESHGNSARDKAETDFSLQTMVDRYASVYERLAGKMFKAGSDMERTE